MSNKAELQTLNSNYAALIESLKEKAVERLAYAEEVSF